MTITQGILTEIGNRNRLRADAKLPLLDVQTEAARLAAVHKEAEFEREFDRRRGEFSHLWAGNNSGFLANMGRYVLARRKIRSEMLKR
jgi:hypothetical protein